jgi:nucleoside-diphosphate-sugar epimerase
VLDDKLDIKALVTGASGFVGGRLRDALLDAGADVVAIRRPRSPQADRGRSVEVDYADRAGLERVLADEQPDVVFHVAGATKGVSYEDFQRANVMPTENLALAVLEVHPDLSRFVHVSSLASYGPSQPDKPHREDAPREPIEHYGKSKLQAEQVLESMADALRWTIIRPAGVYGPGDGDYFNLFREVESGRNVFFGNRHRWFSAVYVDDCVRAIVDCATTDATRSKGYFICDGLPITWGDFQQAIVDASGKRVRTLNLPELLVDVAAFGGELLTRIDKKPRLFNRQKATMGAQSAWTCQHDQARRDFGYRPRVEVPDGVARALAWYRDEGWL